MFISLCLIRVMGILRGLQDLLTCLPVTTSRGIPQAQGTSDPYEYPRNAADNGD